MYIVFQVVQRREIKKFSMEEVDMVLGEVQVVVVDI